MSMFDIDQKHILLIEDNPGDARLISEYLRGQDNFILNHCVWLKDALKLLQTQTTVIDVILLDLALPDSEGLNSFRRLRLETPDTAIVVLTGLDSEDVAMIAIREGAQDYLVKDSINEHVLVRSLRYAIERQRSEQQTRLLAVECERARLMKNFMIDTAHDVRIPLTIINSSTYLLVKSDDPHQRHKCGNRIKKQVKRLEHLFQQIVEMAELDGMTSLNMRPVNVNTILQRLYANLLSSTEEKELHVQLDLQEDLPSIVGNESWLTNAIRQLIDNAVYFSTAQDVVELRTFRSNDSVVIQIKDTGKGISVEDLPNIFDHFYRVDKSRQIETGSTGLGLAIVHRTVALHNGTIAVESEENIGSTFRINLPVSKR